jgi:hypothetical protein
MIYCLVNHHISGHPLVFVLVSTECVMMCLAIDNFASCEICAITCFHHAKIMSAVEIQHEMCVVVYSQNIMSEGSVRRCRMFRDGRTGVHDQEPSGQSAICSE